MKGYLRLLSYIKPYRQRLIEAVVCIVVAAAANLYLPWVIKDMIDKVLSVGFFTTGRGILFHISGSGSSSMCGTCCSESSSGCRSRFSTAIRPARS